MKSDNKEFIIRDYRTTNWFWIEKKVLYMLSDHPMEFIVYCVIAEHWNDKKQNAYPSQQRIADKLKTSTRTIQRALQFLRESGFLRVKPGTGIGRKHAEYELRDMGISVDTTVESPSSATPVSTQGCQSSVDSDTTKKALAIYKEPSEVNNLKDTDLPVGTLASQFLNAYCVAYEKSVGKKYIITNGAKEMTTCKSLVKAFRADLKDLVSRAHAYLADKSDRGFPRKAGWSLGGFSSTVNSYDGVNQVSGIDQWLAEQEVQDATHR